MTNTCIVINCMSGDEKSGELSHFFRVPRDFELQAKWVRAIPKTKEPLTKEHFVCDKHFLESDMIRYYEIKDDAGTVVKNVPYEYPRLNDTAVPSIFPDFEKRVSAENPESLQRTIVHEVVLYDHPLTDAYIYGLHSIGQNVSYDIAHTVSSNRQPLRPEPAATITSPNPTNNEISTGVPGPDGNTILDTTDLAATVATPSGDRQNVANGISGDSAPISGDISQSIASPDVSINGTTDITAQLAASSGDYQIVGNGVAQQVGIIDTVATGNIFLLQNDTATDTMNLVGSISKPDSGWDTVIVTEPTSTFDQHFTELVLPTAVHHGCCGNDGDCCCHCCDYDCNCCDDCDCDGCGDCDCGDCGDCDCGGCDCGGCDCGGCTIM